MRVDISKSNIQANFGKVHWVEAKNRAFYFGADAEWTQHSAVNMRDARIKFEIDPGVLSRAVQREGYVIDGLEISRYRPANSDSEGVVTEDGLFEADLELVRDWQVRDSEDEPWIEWDRESKCWSYWRPASWAEESIRSPGLEEEPQQDPVYARLAEIANVPYDEAVTLASHPCWQKHVVGVIKGQASENALKKYGIEIDWPSSKYHDLARDLADLVVEKQRQYGDSAGRSGKILAVLYPDGIPVEKYDSALLVVRVLDKLSRIATHETDAGGEDPWRDIAGYALLALAGKR